MPKPSEKTQRLLADREKIQQLLSEGKSFRQIGIMYGCSYTLVQYVMKPEMKKAREKATNDRKNRETTGLSPSRFIGHPEPRIEVAGELPPPDTRNLTQRTFGDPLPGRSYLDRMRAKQGA